jgi:hypothetical protein
MEVGVNMEIGVIVIKIVEVVHDRELDHVQILHRLVMENLVKGKTLNQKHATHKNAHHHRHQRNRQEYALSG